MKKNKKFLEREKKEEIHEKQNIEPAHHPSQADLRTTSIPMNQSRRTRYGEQRLIIPSSKLLLQKQRFKNLYLSNPLYIDIFTVPKT